MDALQSTELDRELLQTLVASSAALKKAGVGTGVREAEAVMSELDEQMRESGELTSVLSGPLTEDSELDLEEELKQLMSEGELEDESPAQRAKQSSTVNRFVDHRIPAALPAEQHPPIVRATMVADIVSPVHGF
jgi:regulator of replication initiation timing